VSDSIDVGRLPDEFVHAVGGLVVESSVLTEAIHVPTLMKREDTIPGMSNAEFSLKFWRNKEVKQKFSEAWQLMDWGDRSDSEGRGTE
jgi:hypothetical protein